MPSDFILLSVCLAAALTHAIWNAIVKANESSSWVMVVLSLSAGAFCGLSIPFWPPMAPAAWNYLIISVLIHIVYYFSLSFAYKIGDLSVVYPVARGSAPICIAIISGFVSDDVVTTGMFIGVFIVSIGIFSLSKSSNKHPEAHPKTLLVALIIGLLISCYTLVDGLGARVSNSTIAFIAWGFFLQGTSYSLIMIALNRKTALTNMRKALRPGLLCGTLIVLSYGPIVWAMTVSKMAYIGAVRESSVILAAVIGAVFLKEPFGRTRITASALVVVGIAILHLYH